MKTITTASRFAEYSEPDRVEIVGTVEAEPLGPARTRFRTEPRVVATDEAARRAFRRYWRFFGLGIVLIRLLPLSGLRGDAGRRFRGGSAIPV